MPGHTCFKSPVYVPPPSDNSEEYYEEEYEIESYTPIYYPEDTTNNGPDDTHINTNLNYLPTYLPLLVVFSTLVPIATSLMTNLGLKVLTPIL